MFGIIRLIVTFSSSKTVKNIKIYKAVKMMSTQNNYSSNIHVNMNPKTSCITVTTLTVLTS